jgi:hypothetical protein
LFDDSMICWRRAVYWLGFSLTEAVSICCKAEVTAWEAMLVFGGASWTDAGCMNVVYSVRALAVIKVT